MIPEWVVGLIVPIHKSGSKADPSNYRGISLLSCFGKFFFSILNNRLMHFTTENNIVYKRQLGFMPGYRTTDAHIIMHNLIRETCHNKNSRIYSCFIDFSKAFDTIPHDLLSKKLLKFNITEKMFNIIKSIYSIDKVCIKIDNKITKTSKINQGVRQGCVLSPLLFNIFLSDLPKKQDLLPGEIALDTIKNQFTNFG